MRFSVAALHCFISLTALSCKTYVASGFPTKSPEGDGDFEPLHIRADDHGQAAARVEVDADGSLMMRQALVQSRQISAHAASKGDGEWHDETVHDDDGVGARGVVVMADGALNGRNIDDVTQAVSAETSEHLQRVGQTISQSELRANGALLEDGSVGVSGHANIDSDAAQDSSTAAKVVFVLICLIVPLCVCFFVWWLYPATHDVAAANDREKGEGCSFVGERAGTQEVNLASGTDPVPELQDASREKVEPSASAASAQEVDPAPKLQNASEQIVADEPDNGGQCVVAGERDGIKEVNLASGKDPVRDLQEASKEVVDPSASEKEVDPALKCQDTSGKVDAKALWKQFDRDRSGTLERKEVAAMMGKLWNDAGTGKPLTNLMIDAMLSRLDKDGEGTVSQEEFETSFADLWEECVLVASCVKPTAKAKPKNTKTSTYGKRRGQQSGR